MFKFLSTTEQAAGRDAARLCNLAAARFLTVLEFSLQNLDQPTLGSDLEALRGNIRDLADLSRHVGKTPEEGLAAVEDLQLFAVECGPRARRRIASPNQVVDVIDGLGPINFGLGRAAPAFVTGGRLILHGLGMFTGDHEVRRFEHRFDAHRKQAVEIDATQRVVGPDRRLLLKNDSALVQSVGGTEYRQPSLRIAFNDRPVDGTRAT